MLGPHHVLRPRLTGLLSSERVVVLRGPADSGKSALISEWLRQPGSEERRVVWSTTRSVSRARFWESVATTLTSTLVLAEDHPLETLRRTLAGSGHATTEDLLAAADAVGATRDCPPLRLVLDSFDRVDEQERVGEELLEILERVPRLQLVLASRTRTSFEQPAVRLRLGVRVLPPDDLLLLDHEVGAILGLDPDDSRTPHRIAAVASVTDRRPGPVRLAALELESVPEWTELPASVQDRLRRHLVDALPPTHPDVVALGGEATMLALAAADHVVPELVERLTGRNGRATIEALERLGLGLVAPLTIGRLDGTTDLVSAFRFPRGLRDALAERARSTDPVTWRRARGVVAVWAHGNGLAVEALSAAIDARDYALASRTVVDYLFELGSLNKGAVETALTPLGPRVLAAWPLLAAARALDNFAVHGRQWRTAEYFALAAVGMAARRASAPPTERLLYTTLTMVASRLVPSTGDRAALSATRAAAQIVELSAADREHLARVLPIIGTQIATTLLNSGRPTAAIDAVTSSGTALGEVAPHLRYSALAVRAGASAIAGDLNGARRDLDASDAIPGMQWRHHNVFGSPARLAEAVLHLERGRPAEAAAALERLHEHYPTIENLHLLAQVETWIGLAAGTPAATYEFIDRARREAHQQRRLPRRVDAAMQAHLAELALADGRIRSARDHVQEAHALDPLPLLLLRARLALHRPGAPDDVRRVFQTSARTDASTTPRQRTELALLRLAAGLRTGSPALTRPAATRAIALLDEHALRLPLLVLDPLSLRAVAALEDEAVRPLVGRVGPLLERVPGLTDALLPRLTTRETDVLRALVWTGSAAEIAQQLGTSVNTVKKQIASLYAKLGARNRAEALEAAAGMGFIDRE